MTRFLSRTERSAPATLLASAGLVRRLLNPPTLLPSGSLLPMWYLGPFRWPTARIWVAAAAVTAVFAALALLGVGSGVLEALVAVVVCAVLAIAAVNTLRRLGGPGALGKPKDQG